MTMISRRNFGLSLMAGCAAGALGPAEALATQWKPKQPVEFVIMAGEGGGADQLARVITGIIEKDELSPQPFIPINKPGNSGGDALTYLKRNRGNPNIIMATLNSLFTTPLRQPELGVDLRHLTPVVNLAIDRFVLWVNSETDIINITDYITAVKRAGPENWIMGGTGLGQEDSIVTDMLEKTYGLTHTYKPFKGGGAVAKALLANEINSTVNNPSEQMDLYLEGKTRPIAAFTPMRLDALPEVPTFRELGHDLVYDMPQGIVAPGGITSANQAFYERLFWKVHKSAEWKAYTAKKALYRHWLTRGMLQDYLFTQMRSHVGILRTMGEIG